MIGPRRWSLRSRLLAGLIAVTAIFLVVMGTVTTVVLGNLEQNQFSTDLGLTAKETLPQIAVAGSGYGAAYYTPGTGRVGAFDQPPESQATKALVAWLQQEVGTGQLRALREQYAQYDQFPVTAGPGYPALTATFRYVDPDSADLVALGGLIPAGRSVLFVGRPDSAVGSQVRGLVLAEVLTGAILLALLAVGGRWLIARGLAPLDKMAGTADMITSQGDLTARMPDPGDHAEAGRLAGAINTMLDRIQQAFVARYQSEQKVRQFAADASHELRTPLTTIRGYAELFRQGALGETQLPNAMRRIEQEADRMSSLVAELLELARLDRMSSLDLTETDLSELVRDAVADARAVEPGRPVSARVPPDFVVVADEPRIRQVLANLLGNVREHTPSDTAVTVRLSQAGHGALIEVADRGQGMDEDAAERAFDRFYRGPRSDGSPGIASGGHGGVVPPGGSRVVGSGLGLAIVQAIAAAHGGHAMLRSVPGVGTTVQVWIPFRTIDAERTAVRPSVYT